MTDDIFELNKREECVDSEIFTHARAEQQVQVPLADLWELFFLMTGQRWENGKACDSPRIPGLSARVQAECPGILSSPSCASAAGEERGETSSVTFTGTTDELLGTKFSAWRTHTHTHTNSTNQANPK